MSATLIRSAFHQGALVRALEQRRLARARSPRARAGRIGGVVSQQLHPASARPRGPDGRFITPKGGAATQESTYPQHKKGRAVPQTQRAHEE